MSTASDLGYKVEGFTYQTEEHTFKGHSRMEGRPN